MTLFQYIIIFNSNECGAFRTVALKNLHKFLISEHGQ